MADTARHDELAQEQRLVSPCSVSFLCYHGALSLEAFIIVRRKSKDLGNTYYYCQGQRDDQKIFNESEVDL